MVQESNAELRQHFRNLVSTSGLTQRECANLIAKEGRWPCGERKLRSWLTDLDTPTARGVPLWAVKALEKGLAKRDKKLKK